MADDPTKGVGPLADGDGEANLVRAARGGSVLFSGKLFTYIARFAITILLTRLLGEDEYGRYNLALTLPAFAASFAILGLDTAVIRFVALHSARGETGRVLGVLQLGIFLPIAVSMAFAAVLFAIAPWVATEVFHDERLGDLIRLAVLTIPLLAAINQLDAALTGLRHIERSVVATHFVQPVLRLVMIVALALVGLNAAGAIGAYVIAIGAVTLLMVVRLRRSFSIETAGPAEREARPLIGYALPVYLSNVATVAGDNLQTILLGALSTVATVGIFAVANQVTMIGKMFHNAVTAASMPLIAQIHDQGDRAQLAGFFRTTTRWTTTFNLPFLLILVLFAGPLMAIFGKGFEVGAEALGLLAIANLAIFATGPVGAIIDMTGNTRLKLANSVALVTLSVGLNVALIPGLGLLGAAIAALVANVAINVARLIEVYVLLRIQPYDASFLKPLIAGAVGAAAALAVGAVVPADQRGPGALLGSLALIGAYVAAILALGLSPDDRALLRRVRDRLLGNRSAGRDERRDARREARRAARREERRAARGTGSDE